MQNPNSPWRLPPADDRDRPRYNLHNTLSMVNLLEEPSWSFNRGPPSPTASSVSSATSTSRSATPTISNNPWSNIMSSPSSTISTRPTTSNSSPPNTSPNRTPQYTSRSTTPIASQPSRPINPGAGVGSPVAPKPLRPMNPAAGFVPMTSQSSPVGENLRGIEYPASPIPNFPGSPNPYRQSAPSFPLLVNGFINPAIISSQGQSLSGWFYEMARSQRWEPSLLRKIWSWALTNQKIALLLVVCEDLASWRQAAFHYLRDENLPFPEDRLHGIVADPRRIVNEQWRATAKELPLNGSHVDFAPRETLPLQQISPVRTLRSPETSADQVQMLGGSDDRVFVRKRFVITRPSQKAALLKQINEYKQYDHKNIAKILSSYSQPSHVGIITAKAQYTLDDFLALSSHDSNRPRILLDWMQDLAQALEYIHSQSLVVDHRTQSICHRSIRPRKILIDGSRIYFAAFGIGTHNNDWLSPSVPSPQRLDQLQSYFQDQTYIYAAPEAIRSRSKRPADVFSLGCVFLSMMTVVQNQPLSMFTQYRAASSQDASFHAHLDRVNAWRQRLLYSINSALRNGAIGPGRKQRQLRSEADWLQHILPRMLDQQPKDRIKMGRLCAQLGKLGDGAVGGGRRRSLDEGGLSGKAAASLNINSNGTNGTSVGGGGNRQPELSVFDGYFQQQERYEQGHGW